MSRKARPLSKLLRVLASDPRVGWELIEAQYFLATSRWARHRAPVGRLFAESRPHQDLTPNRQSCVARVVAAVDRVARFGIFPPTCLEYAMTLQRMLERRGIGPAVIRVGVQVQDSRFAAHAWVQLGDQVIGDSAVKVSRFQYLADLKEVRL